MNNLRLTDNTIQEEGRKNQTTICKEQKQTQSAGEMVFQKQMKDVPDAKSKPTHSSSLSLQNMKCVKICVEALVDNY